jgi:hypothetical protein
VEDRERERGRDGYINTMEKRRRVTKKKIANYIQINSI